MRWLFLFLFFSVNAMGSDVPLLHVNDTINPGTGDYIIRNIQRAEETKAPFLILQLDTPGGLLSTTRQIIQAMLNARIPIVVFIGPRGAQAGSAGALITFAADVAAMAPGSNIGAAHPVTESGGDPSDTMKEKITNDTAAFAESLARAKGRNREWAIQAVTKSASIPAEQALKTQVIDLIADDSLELLKKLSSYPLRVPKNGIQKLAENTSENALSLSPVPFSIKQRLVAFFSNPSLAYLIMTAGTLCLWIELSHPGLVVPGVVGALCLLISLISFQLMPIDYGALALIFVGLALLVAELFVPAFGILGIGGIVCFTLGSLFLIDSSVPELKISLSLILPTAAVLVGAALGLGYLVLKSRRKKVSSGIEAMIGDFGEVRVTVSPQSGTVFIQGELWNAVCQAGEIPSGTTVAVKAVNKMVLLVEPIIKE